MATVNVMITLDWRSTVTDSELNVLHADAFTHRLFDDAWNDQLQRWSLGWVTARRHGDLVGFVNVLTDGGVHVWIQDVIVASTAQRQGIGRRMIDVVREQVTAVGCEWLHVDFDDEHTDFYIGACGFTPARAGLIRLDEPVGDVHLGSDPK